MEASRWSHHNPDHPDSFFFPLSWCPKRNDYPDIKREDRTRGRVTSLPR